MGYRRSDALADRRARRRECGQRLAARLFVSDPTSPATTSGPRPRERPPRCDKIVGCCAPSRRECRRATRRLRESAPVTCRRALHAREEPPARPARRPARSASSPSRGGVALPAIVARYGRRRRRGRGSTMKPAIHPDYQVVNVHCACGATWTTPVDEEGAAAGDLLQLPPVLHRQAAHPRRRRPRRALQPQVRQEGSGRQGLTPPAARLRGDHGRDHLPEAARHRGPLRRGRGARCRIPPWSRTRAPTRSSPASRRRSPRSSSASAPTRTRSRS